jgi:hypothetical protein
MNKIDTDIKPKPGATGQFSLLLSLVSFVITIFCARYFTWTATDLLWSLWISSLTVGYVTILLSIGSWLVRGTIVSGLWADVPNLKSQRFPTLMGLPVALFMLAFFSFHFLGFHLGHSMFLSFLFPLPGYSIGSVFENCPSLIYATVSQYWPFVLASLLAMQDKLKAAAWHGSLSNVQAAYGNVVKMHITILLIFPLGIFNLHHYLLYLVLIIYFFPIKELIFGKGQTSRMA